jgi:ADP-ribosylation factor-like protein 8
MWERYCRGVSAILFVVDSSIPISNTTKSDTNATSNPWAIASEELHSLMSRPQLAGIPLLVLATKNDVKGAVSAEDVIREM